MNSAQYLLVLTISGYLSHNIEKMDTFGIVSDYLILFTVDLM